MTSGSSPTRVRFYFLAICEKFWQQSADGQRFPLSSIWFPPTIMQATSIFKLNIPDTKEINKQINQSINDQIGK